MKTPSAKAKSHRGTSLLEVLITLAILAGAGLGTLASLGAGTRALREGQLTQFKMLLLDAKSQQLLLQDKSTLLAGAQSTSWPVPNTGDAHYPPAIPLGPPSANNPWRVDPQPPAATTDQKDLSTGSYFAITPTGRIVKLDRVAQPVDGIVYPGVPDGTNCGNVALPPNIYCRETALTVGPPIQGALGSLPQLVGNNLMVTFWVRVTRTGETIQTFVRTSGQTEALNMYRREVIVP